MHMGIVTNRIYNKDWSDIYRGAVTARLSYVKISLSLHTFIIFNVSLKLSSVFRCNQIFKVVILLHLIMFDHS